MKNKMSSKNSINLSTKEAVTLSTELILTGVYVNVTAVFARKMISNKGEETEKILIDDTPQEQVHVQYVNDDLPAYVGDDIEGLVKKAIAQAEDKHKLE